jgi:hypothetical protein
MSDCVVVIVPINMLTHKCFHYISLSKWRWTEKRKQFSYWRKITFTTITQQLPTLQKKNILCKNLLVLFPLGFSKIQAGYFTRHSNHETLRNIQNAIVKITLSPTIHTVLQGHYFKTPPSLVSSRWVAHAVHQANPAGPFPRCLS